MMEALKQTCPFEYPVVMDIIKVFLHCAETLRSCRCVNKAWHKHFNRKALLKSTFVGLERIAFAAPESLGFGTLTLEEEEVSVGSNIERLKVKDRVELLQHENVVKYFEMNGNQLKFFSFEVAKNDKMSLVHLQFIENVLYKWCSQLEELELVGLVENGVTGTVEDLDENDIPLRKFVLNYTGTSFPSDNIRMTVILKILERAKNLDSFVFIGCQFDPQLEYISGEIVRLLSDNTINLSTLELCDVPVGEHELTVMTRAGFRLRKFVFEGLPKRNLMVYHLNLFLEAYAMSLEHLHLKVHWITSFPDVGLELGVHMLPNLNVLKIAVRNVKVGISGLLGNVEKLHDITLWGSSELIGSERVSFETMFRRKASTSIKSIRLDKAYVGEFSTISKWCPTFSELEIDVPATKINEFLFNLNELVSSHSLLEDLNVNVHFEVMEVHNDDFMKCLVTGLLNYQLRSLKIIAMHDMDNLPWIRHAWIEEGLFGNNNKYFCIDLNGFCIRDDEVEGIAMTLTGRANLTIWVGFKVIGMNTGGVLRLKKTTFFSENVKSLSKDIVKCVQEKEKINSKLNSDSRNIKIWKKC